MEDQMIEMIILNLPNFLGLFIAVLLEYRIIQRLMDKIDRCDCHEDPEAIEKHKVSSK